MHKTSLYSLVAALFVAMPLAASEPTSQEKESSKETSSFAAFTGKISKKNVRVRTQPSLDAHIVKILHPGEMVVVVGEDDEFYAIQPPSDIKSYIFRTYVLDGVVEGHNVNVRLEPVLESPVIAQLNTGDTVTGRVSPLNSKWIEIVPPKDTVFYVSKDFVEKIGDSHYMAKMQKRRDEVHQLLDNANETSRISLQEPFDEIDYNEVVGKFQTILNNYPEFDQQVSRAQEGLNEFREAYIKKKIAFLEAKSQEFTNAEILQKENHKLTKAYTNQQMQLQQLQQQLAINENNNHQTLPQTPTTMSAWLPIEEELYKEWSNDSQGDGRSDSNSNNTLDDFYQEQHKTATQLRGSLEPYTKNIKNKPGDFVLLNSNKMPIAFLYSTQVDLQGHVGQEINVTVTPRPNHNFAYPAYFVLSVE